MTARFRVEAEVWAEFGFMPMLMSTADAIIAREKRDMVYVVARELRGFRAAADVGKRLATPVA